MNKRDYDKAIAEHYKSVAEAEGLSWSSTMADSITRDMETEHIARFVSDAAASRTSGSGPVRVLDTGCGNGYTLGILAGQHPGIEFTGVEYSDDMRMLAEKRVTAEKLENVEIRAGDVRELSFPEDERFDALICQRVLINLLDPGDQKGALDNLVSAVKPGGALLFIEAFETGLERINRARAEFGLPAIPPAHHNLYLPDDFFEHDALEPYTSETWDVPENVFSTHYFVSRVFFPVVLGDRPFVRNTAFVKFFSEALKPDVGDFTQLRLLALARKTG